MRGPAADNWNGRPASQLGRYFSTRFLLVVAFCGSIGMLSGPLRAEQVRRLPPVRLPPLNTASPAGVDQQARPDDQPGTREAPDDIIRLAGGAVELHLRPGWWIWEIPTGREIRVAMSPLRPASLKKVPDAGHWVCFHLNEGTDPSRFGLEPQAYLSARLAQRLRKVTSGEAVPLNSEQFHKLGSWDAIEQEFSWQARPGDASTTVRGSHILVSTSWGLFEFHTRFPPDQYDQHLAETARILKKVKLSAPTEPVHGPGTDATRAAGSIHGSWKAFRSRLRLLGNGEIEIARDRTQVISPPEAASFEADRLQGRYRAEGDLLFVDWQDGSKLNFRWKLREGDLLLTDHEGQISQLRRIAE